MPETHARLNEPSADDTRGPRREASFLVNMVLLPGLTQLDLTGPHEVLARLPGARIELVAASMEPVRSDKGLTIVPTIARDMALPADLLVVPGGPGVDLAILDRDWVSFVAAQGQAARWIFGICTGSLLLGAAGLLRGRRSGGHWTARDLLSRFGASVSEERMTVDGNLFTAGGVTAGIDMALLLAAHVAGEDTARRIQLQIEYDPQPPFRSGTPSLAAPEIVQSVMIAGAEKRRLREDAVEKAAQALESAVKRGGEM